MRIIFLIFLIFLNNCSFDNKSGIWKSESGGSQKDDKILRDFKKIQSIDKPYDVIKRVDTNFIFSIGEPFKTKKWNDIFYGNTNNFKNFSYIDQGKQIIKSKKLSRFEINKNILFYNDIIFVNDLKGNIIYFSLSNNKKINKFNFYKKNYKKIKKKLNVIIENDTIYISDNLGYLYAYDFIKKDIIWAKNYKIPFRSNLKIKVNMIIESIQNNNLFFFDKTSGDIIKLIPTEETIINNQFISNITISNKSIFFLNTYGSLYSINHENLKINWFLNLNQSINLNLANTFVGSQIIFFKDKLVVSSNNFFYLINASNGSIIYKKNFSTLIKPIVISDYIFLISKNDLLISLNLNDGKILYSHDINQQLSEFLNTKKRKVDYRNFMTINSKIFIFLKNGYVIKLNINGELEKVDKFLNNFKSKPIIIDGKMIYLNSNNKILIVN